MITRGAVPEDHNEERHGQRVQVRFQTLKQRRVQPRAHRRHRRGG